MSRKRWELTLEELEIETGINRTKECRADYWACRNTLLDEDGNDRFLDLGIMLPDEAMEKLDYLLNRYLFETRKNRLRTA